MEHKVKFICCDCEATSITLVRAGLWPASPKNPQVAYTFELLNVMEALMLECQVSLKDFCEAVKLWCPFIILDRKKIYPGIIDSFEEYRYIICGGRHYVTLTWILVWRRTLCSLQDTLPPEI